MAPVTLYRFVAHAWGEALDALWPRRCRLCGAAAPDDIACDEHRLPLSPPGPRCGRCAAALASFSPDGDDCPACRRAPPPWRRATVLGDYRTQPVLRDWILSLKHGGRADLADVLGRALAQRVGATGLVDVADPDPLIVPVPLHPWRRLERGHDQVRLLAQALSAGTSLSWSPLLKRTRDTPPQGEAWAPPRATNVRDAFRLRRAPFSFVRRAETRPLAGRTLLLLDDVITSGNTAAACTRVLRRAGARHVDLLALARAGA
jgi:ComF family protein